MFSFGFLSSHTVLDFFSVLRCIDLCLLPNFICDFLEYFSSSVFFPRLFLPSHSTVLDFDIPVVISPMGCRGSLFFEASVLFLLVTLGKRLLPYPSIPCYLLCSRHYGWLLNILLIAVPFWVLNPPCGFFSPSIPLMELLMFLFVSSMFVIAC